MCLISAISLNTLSGSFFMAKTFRATKCSGLMTGRDRSPKMRSRLVSLKMSFAVCPFRGERKRLKHKQAWKILQQKDEHSPVSDSSQGQESRSLSWKLFCYSRLELPDADRVMPFTPFIYYFNKFKQFLQGCPLLLFTTISFQGDCQ